MELWDYYTPEELKKLFKEKPLTADCIDYFLHQKIKKIEFSADFTNSGALQGSERYIIYVSLQEKDPEVGLIHEIIHAYYNVGLPAPHIGRWDEDERKKAEILDDMIEKEAQRFCEENKEFVKQIYLEFSD